MGIKNLVKQTRGKTLVNNTKEDDSENSNENPKNISNTDKETKQTNVLENKEPLKTDKAENIGENTKKELNDILNADKETYRQTLSNRLQ